jgi:hypothetical protein
MIVDEIGCPGFYSFLINYMILSQNTKYRVVLLIFAPMYTNHTNQKQNICIF